MSESIFAPGFKTDPYWWDAAPPEEAAETPLPEETDVVVVGAGVTGLQAALTLLRGGREALVLEADHPGYGASTRNAGNIIPYLWAKLDWLERTIGPAETQELAGAGKAALGYVLDFLREEQINCGLTESDRYYLALTKGHFRKMEKDVAFLEARDINTGWEAIPPEELRRRTGLGRYHGAIHVPGSLSIHPGLYVAALVDRVTQAGGRIASRTAVTGVTRADDGTFTVATSRGPVRARDVVMATNGYTPEAAPWMRRRVIPFISHMAATEPLPEDLMRELFPERRLYIDSKINITWIRLTPDGKCAMVGGRTGMSRGDLRRTAAELHGDMTRILPELSGMRFTHCWEGQMGFTFDRVPHTGEHDGIHYAMGFCGIGVTMGSYLGHKLGRKLLGAPDAGTPFDGRAFKSRLFYTGNPWVVPIMIRWFNFRDRWDQWWG